MAFKRSAVRLRLAPPTPSGVSPGPRLILEPDSEVRGNPDGALADESPIDRAAIDATYGALPGPDVIRTHAYVSLWETAMLIVASTDAMADCPRSLATRYAARLGLQVLDPPFPPFRFTVQAVRRAGAADPGLDWFMTKLSAAIEA